MRTDKWKIFSKSGSNLNPYTDSFLNIEFLSSSQNAREAAAYAITNTDLIISDVNITNSGWNYDPNTQAKLTYSFGPYSEILSSTEASINFIDISIFSPEPNNTKGIGSVNIDISTEFTYPSVILAAAVFMTPVSIQLVETEHLTIFEESSLGSLIRPYDTENNTLVFKFSDGDQEIKLFDIDHDTQTLIWTDEILFNTSIFAIGSPIIINIGFSSEEEGVYERKLRAYHRVNGRDYQVAEILVNSQSIGPDERFDTLAQNFGLPNPKNIPHLFKEANINESMPDWQLLNYKGKHIVLEHDKIMPYIGTYKALINAIKWLGYEDIKIKEWFSNVKNNTKLSLYIPYESVDRTKTILKFSADERKNLKKLNQLSLIYCINKETGELDEWGNPITENSYEYNLNEVLIKLKSLKDWLEKNIIGVNAKIADITGEGIYFERFRNFIYATQDKGTRAVLSQSLTPVAIDKTSELIKGGSNMGLTLVELSKTAISKYDSFKIKDFLQYYWDPSNLVFSESDASLLWWDPSTIAVGTPFRAPLFELQDIQWRASIENTYSGVLTNEFITNPLFIYNNDIRFYDILDSSAVFFDASTGIKVILEKAFLKDAPNDNWLNSIQYSIYQDSSDFSKYIIESSMGIILKTEGPVNLRPNTLLSNSPLLQYAFDNNYNVPLLSIRNYKFTDSSGNIFGFENEKLYFLDIAEGKISMGALISEPSSFTKDPSTIYYKREDKYINWNYDTSLREQKITLNTVYTSPRAPLYIYDPSIYYNSGPETALVFDNSIYKMIVNHIGSYKIEIFGWDTQNNIYRNFLRDDHQVWTKFPIIWSYLEGPCKFGTISACPSAMLSINDISILAFENENSYPIFDSQVGLHGLTFEKDVNGKHFINVPSISYFTDLPKPGSLARFYNLTERIVNRNSDIFTVAPDFQEFYTNDDINLVLFDKRSHSILAEVSGNISYVSGNDLTILNIPLEFDINTSASLYILNNTSRTIYILDNDIVNKQLTVNVSTYTFDVNQLVGIIIEDVCTGYSWGSSFRVIDVSTADPLSWGNIPHLFEGNIPQSVINSPSRYNITAKHAFSTFVDFNINVSTAFEKNNNFKIYLDDYYYHQYYLDNTFVYVNMLFDQGKVLDQWYDQSTDSMLVSESYYPRTNSINIDPSTLVILDSYFDPSNYMLNQKNIWTVKESGKNKVLFRVFNKTVPFIFTDSGVWDVKLESYDKFGNLKTQNYEGLITVK